MEKQITYYLFLVFLTLNRTHVHTSSIIDINKVNYGQVNYSLSLHKNVTERLDKVFRFAQDRQDNVD
jgi:adenylate kinase